MPKLRQPPAGRQAAAVVPPEEDETKVENPDNEVVIETNTDDAVVQLQKQLDDMRKQAQEAKEAKEQAERDRADAIKSAQARQIEVESLQKQTVQSELDAVSAAMAAAKAEADSAERDLEAATQAGDTRAQALAYRKLARAEGDLARLEAGKDELEAKAKEPPPKKAEPVLDDPLGLERTNLPLTAKTWLRKHPEYLTNPRKNAKIQSLHWDVVDEGHEPFSDAYYESLEQHLGLREAPRTNSEQVEEPPIRPARKEAAIVSAPVSRDGAGGPNNSASGIRLTAAQKEAAKLSGITEAEYAKQLVKYNKAKEDGLIQ